jgi:hypothetical protein
LVDGAGCTVGRCREMEGAGAIAAIIVQAICIIIIIAYQLAA